MIRSIIIALCLAAYARATDVVLGRLSDLTWGGSGTDRVAQWGTPAAVGNPNLVGWWKLDGNGVDSSGYGNTGTLVGSPTNATDRLGVMGGAIAFSGSGQYVNIADTAGLNITNRPLSVMVWVFPRKSGGGWVISRTEDAVNETQYGMLVDTNTSVSYLEGVVRGSVATGNRWTHLAFVWGADGSTRTYTNAALAATTATVTTPLTPRANIKLAARSSSTNGAAATAAFDGLLDDVRVYKQELTPAQIATSMQGGQP